TSLHIKSEDMERHVEHIYRKYDEIKKNEVRFEEIMTEDAEYLIVAYGLSARISHKSVNILREKGIKAGLLRPITLYPFPEEKINQLAEKMKLVLTVEMNTGQMVEDVRLSVNGKVPVHFFGRFGGMIPDPEEIVNKFENLINKNHAL
ncbi:MAG TPA: 3-methyl-2-oxobutanoate dehydrogenase subunit beta, partial [Bacteroidetes bacterium]|nr:3-methyl-2-oxobutanoate dehydrogenase subunit beta [Bacteroidota bacterium]